jgi:hypothetical protein
MEKQLVGKFAIVDGEISEVVSGPFEGNDFDEEAGWDQWVWVSNEDGDLKDVDLKDLEVLG